MIARVKTGIPGMDEVLNGGIPERNVVLLSGGPGTGKSIFSQQFIWSGLELGEPGIYVALEEHPVQIRQNMAQFGWDVRKYEDDGIFAIVDAFTAGIGKSREYEKYIIHDLTDTREFIDVLRSAIKDINAKRVVIDSVTTLYINKPALARSIILQLKRVLAGMGATALFVSQISVGERGFGGPGVEHGVDGIIRLDLDEIDGELKRSLIVWKMRGTRHSMRRHPFEIKDEGVIVYPEKVLKI
ncbi:KaiC domain-containing protein [Palaeococcus sp. (in: euryarchaeotes)]|uniref:KaiC domain-containing protein n=1 Tax=Palaeococcus sp. (in: euryarchaeotes) TaxID=2820298 RepID=UPI000F1499F8|nr:KaiC domain-containing protein [Palaeococcus sp. (in: euryarchaeotes)]MCD6560131.1 KaiC domain-containing protein [Palaeococcus sp. (in: euryarchaeotes)]RLF75849.1 MAG: KaiC domain-containing protein [Thermococci archaeon]